MTVNIVSGTSTANNAKAFQVTGSEWTSGTLQWSNKPAADILLEENISHNNKTKYQFSCLSAVQHWYDGDTTGQNENYGIMLCYQDPEIADYNSFYSADCTDATMRPALTISYNPPNNTLDVDEGKTLTLSVSGAIGTVTWTSSNTSVATVNSNGVVTGIKAGIVTITAYVDGNVFETFTVYVTIVDGVYYIKNTYFEKYLSTTGGVAEQTLATLKNKATSGLSQLQQLWKIVYLGNGYYSIRPMYALSMALHATSNTVDIVTVGTIDSLTVVPLVSRWGIEAVSGGYTFMHAGTGSLKMGSYESYSEYYITTGNYASGATASYWTLEKVSSVPTQVLLLDTQTGLSAEGVTRFVGNGTSATLADFGLSAHFVNANSISQTISWSSSDASVVTVDSETGEVTGRTAGGTATITAKHFHNGVAYSKSYAVHVAVVASGTYCVMNQGSEGYLQVDSGNTNNSGSTETIAEQMINNSSDHRKWILTLLDDGYYSIKSAKNGLALSIPSGQTASTYVSITLEQYTGSNRQKWSLTELSNHHVKIKPKSAEGASSDLVLAVIDSGTNVSAGNSVMQLIYIQGEDYADEWQICSPVHIGMSTDDYTSGCKNGGLDSYYYANVFYNNLLNVTGEGLFALTHHYNNEDVQTASSADFGVNGAISDDIDFMVYMGHGHAAHDSSGNHMHYDCGNATTLHTQSTTVDDDTYCNLSLNVYSSQIKFGSDTSNLRWVWLYTCNFLHTLEDNNDNDSNTSNDNGFVTNADLLSMMDGAHMVMGYASRATLCGNMAEDFGEYLHDGMPVYEAFLLAGYTGEASVEPLNHYQKIVYIPQARYETIYSPAVHYDYDPLDAIIYKKNIQDQCVFS